MLFIFAASSSINLLFSERITALEFILFTYS
jgi:hypothetical protein